MSGIKCEIWRLGMSYGDAGYAISSSNSFTSGIWSGFGSSKIQGNARRDESIVAGFWIAWYLEYWVSAMDCHLQAS